MEAWPDLVSVPFTAATGQWDELSMKLDVTRPGKDWMSLADALGFSYDRIMVTFLH